MTKIVIQHIGDQWTVGRVVFEPLGTFTDPAYADLFVSALQAAQEAPEAPDGAEVAAEAPEAAPAPAGAWYEDFETAAAMFENECDELQRALAESEVANRIWPRVNQIPASAEPVEPEQQAEEPPPVETADDQTVEDLREALEQLDDQPPPVPQIPVPPEVIESAKRMAEDDDALLAAANDTTWAPKADTPEPHHKRTAPTPEPKVKPDAPPADDSEDIWDEAIQRVAAGEKIKVVADDMGLQWTLLRAKYGRAVATGKVKKPEPMEPDDAPVSGGVGSVLARGKKSAWSEEEDKRILDCERKGLFDLAGALKRPVSEVVQRRSALEAKAQAVMGRG